MFYVKAVRQIFCCSQCGARRQYGYYNVEKWLTIPEIASLKTENPTNDIPVGWSSNGFLPSGKRDIRCGECT